MTRDQLIETAIGALSDKGTARADAIRKVVDKCRACRRPYHEEQIIESFEGLTSAEAGQIREDWEVSARSNIT